MSSWSTCPEYLHLVVATDTVTEAFVIYKITQDKQKSSNISDYSRLVKCLEKMQNGNQCKFTENSSLSSLKERLSNSKDDIESTTSDHLSMVPDFHKDHLITPY